MERFIQSFDYSLPLSKALTKSENEYALLKIGFQIQHVEILYKNKYGD